MNALRDADASAFSILAADQVAAAATDAMAKALAGLNQNQREQALKEAALLDIFRDREKAQRESAGGWARRLARQAARASRREWQHRTGPEGARHDARRWKVELDAQRQGKTAADLATWRTDMARGFLASANAHFQAGVRAYFGAKSPGGAVVGLERLAAAAVEAGANGEAQSARHYAGAAGAATRAVATAARDTTRAARSVLLAAGKDAPAGAVREARAAIRNAEKAAKAAERAGRRAENAARHGTGADAARAARDAEARAREALDSAATALAKAQAAVPQQAPHAPAGKQKWPPDPPPHCSGPASCHDEKACPPGSDCIRCTWEFIGGTPPKSKVKAPGDVVQPDPNTITTDVGRRPPPPPPPRAPEGEPPRRPPDAPPPPAHSGETTDRPSAAPPEPPREERPADAVGPALVRPRPQRPDPCADKVAAALADLDADMEACRTKANVALGMLMAAFGAGRVGGVVQRSAVGRALAALGGSVTSAEAAAAAEGVSRAQALAALVQATMAAVDCGASAHARFTNALSNANCPEARRLLNRPGTRADAALWQSFRGGRAGSATDAWGAALSEWLRVDIAPLAASMLRDGLREAFEHLKVDWIDREAAIRTAVELFERSFAAAASPEAIVELLDALRLQKDFEESKAEVPFPLLLLSEIGLGMVPVLGQILDVLDLLDAIDAVRNSEGFWATTLAVGFLTLAVVAFVPLYGDIAKALGKGGRRLAKESADEAAQRAAARATQQVLEEAEQRAARAAERRAAGELDEAAGGHRYAPTTEPPNPPVTPDGPTPPSPPAGPVSPPGTRAPDGSPGDAVAPPARGAPARPESNLGGRSGDAAHSGEGGPREPSAIEPGQGASQDPIRPGEVTTYEDFVDRSVIGDNIEGHEVWQHANQKAQGLTDRRLGTAASKENPVIALEHDVHKRVNSVQRAINAASQTPIDNIRANIEVLRRLGVAPPSALDALERMALQHARRLGF